MSVKCLECQSNNLEAASFCAVWGTKLHACKDIDIAEAIEVPREKLTGSSNFAGRDG